MVRPMVHSTKHYVQTTLSTVTTGNTAFVNYATAVTRTVANLGNEVAEGSTIKAIYWEMWVIGSVSNQFFTAIIAKIPGGGANIVQADMVDLFSYDNKKNILYTTQGLASNDGIAGPVAIYRGWIKIPKSKQRWGLGDKFQFAISSRGSDDIIFCGFATYKEYS